MLKCLKHLFVHGLICLGKILTPLRMADDHIFNSGICEHVRSDLACVSAFFLIIHVLSADTDVASLGSFHGRYDVNGRNAEYYVHIVICYQWF